MAPLRRIDRRTALKWMLTAAASTALAPSLLKASLPSHRTIGTDPDLQAAYKTGDFWLLTFNEAQRLTAAALCDTIIPADDVSPAASTVGVVDFIDEWISAPYPDHVVDRQDVLACLAWMETTAQTRFAKNFHLVDDAARQALCDEVCHTAAAGELAEPARLFAKFRDLTAGGFYTTPEGRTDVGYVGNVPLITFDGPPPAVLRQAGLLD